MRALVLAIALLVLLAAPAAAGTRPCLDGGGPACHVQTGEVTFVADGDTIDVDFDGDGTHVARRVRLTGVQAMEQTTYSHTPARRRGDCHALAATARLERLVRRAAPRVRLAAQDLASHSGRRLRRQLSLRIGGRWVDAGAVLLAEGHALWLPNGTEWAWNRTYAELAQRAATAGLRLWNPAACGSRVAAGGVRLGLALQYDAPGADGRNVNGEWARIDNPSGIAVSLAGWWFRDSDLRRFTFPAGASIPPGGSVTLHVGAGSGGRGVHHWGQVEPVFENPTGDARAIGDGGYLFDPQGNLRAWSIYPWYL